MTLPRDPDALFARARAELSPSAADEARVLSAITSKLPPSGGGGSGGASGGGAGVATTVKVAGGIALAGAIALGVSRLMSAPGAAPIAPVPSAPAPTAMTVTAPTLIAPPGESSPGIDVGALPNARATSSSPSSPGAPTKPASSADALAAEIRLVERMHVAEKSGDLAKVVSLAADHEREFPNGVLVEEREASRTVASCMRDRSTRASALEAFRRRFPRSTHDARVTSACASDRLDP